MSTLSRRWSLAAIALGLLGCGFGLLLDRRVTMVSYLTIWIASSAVPIGSVGVLPFTYLVRGGWTEDLHRPLMLASLTIPVAAILFVPIAANLAAIYPWVEASTSLSSFQHVWLVPWFFVLRAFVYLTVLFAMALWLGISYGDQAAQTRSASGAAIVWAPVVSLAGIDWIESVEPHFHSSIFGLLVLSDTLLTAFACSMALALVRACELQMRPGAYAGTLLSVLLLWVYLHAMQYLIIWSGNLPDETVWYIERLEGAWAILLWSLFILQFIVPFFLLLSDSIRSNWAALFWLAAATLALRYLEAAVLILPPLHVSGVVLVLAIPASLLLIGGCLALAWDGARNLLARLDARRGAPI